MLDVLPGQSNDVLGSGQNPGYDHTVTKAGMMREGGRAEYMLIQCTPLLVEKAGVAPDVTLRCK